jgi:hypothetical protein
MEMGQSGADQNPASRHFKGGAASGNALQFGHGRSSETGKELRTSAPQSLRSREKGNEVVKNSLPL